jgi:iron-sulfur cluster assembly protein
MTQVIKLSDNAAKRIKEIMSSADNTTIGVRVGVESGGCAGMSYIMEYAKDIKPNEEVIEDKSFNRSERSHVPFRNRNGL